MQIYINNIRDTFDEIQLHHPEQWISIQFISSNECRKPLSAAIPTNLPVMSQKNSKSKKKSLF